MSRRRDSELLKALVPDRERIWLPPARRGKQPEREISLKEFSFLDNPIHTLSMIENLARAECTVASGRLNFEDEYISDIGPYLILGLMRQSMVPFLRGGRMLPAVQKVIDAVGLREFLEMGPFKGHHDRRDVWALSLRHRRGEGTTTADDLAQSSTREEKVQDELVKTVDHWLGELNPSFELTKAGKSWLNCILGEILDNAKRHSREDGDGNWSVVGFMAKRSQDLTGNEIEPFYSCHLAIVSQGLSIADSIASCDQKTKLDLSRYHKKHEHSGHSVEELSTVFAMQDGISRFSQGCGHSKGGVGMMDMVEFINELADIPCGGLRPKLAVISGETCILFRDRYFEGVKTPTNQRRTQWFNQSNDSGIPPDGSYVFSMPYRFPGTLICMRFCIKDTVLEERDGGQQTSD